MPYSVALHSSPRLATIRFTGQVSPLDVRDACVRLLDLSGWRAGTPQVWDFSGTSGVDSTPETWAQLLDASEANRSRIGANRVAIVSRDPDLKPLLETYAHAFRQSGRTFRLAATARDAQAWLEGNEAAVKAV